MKLLMQSSFLLLLLKAIVGFTAIGLTLIVENVSHKQCVKADVRLSNASVGSKNAECMIVPDDGW